MDKFISVMAFPIGLFLCFGPAIFVWLKEELGAANPQPAQGKKSRKK